MALAERALVAIPICIFLPLISLLAILLSLHIQRQRGSRASADAYVFLAAWLVTTSLAVYTTHSASAGDLRGHESTPSDQSSPPGKVPGQRLAHQILTGAAIQLVRVGLLLLYRRIFVQPRFRLAVAVMLGVTCAYSVIVIAGFTALYVVPPADVVEAGVDTPAVYLATGAISMGFDAATLVLPATAIRSLHLSRRKKIGLIGVFGLGGVSMAASAMRVYWFVELLRVRDLSQTGTAIFNINIWSVVEPFVSIVAACLPTCATLLRDRAYAPARAVGRFMDKVTGSGRESRADGSTQIGSLGSECYVLTAVAVGGGSSRSSLKK